MKVYAVEFSLRGIGDDPNYRGLRKIEAATPKEAKAAVEAQLAEEGKTVKAHGTTLYSV